MCQIAVQNFFTPEFPVKVSTFEKDKGHFMPTYFLMKELKEKMGRDSELYFIMGTDILPTLK